MGASHNRGRGATAPAGRNCRPDAAFATAPALARALASALVLGFLLPACQAPTLRARQADAEAAERATRSGDWPRAAELWHAVYVAQGGSEVRAYHETARALLHTGDHDSACAMLDQGLLVFPDDPDLLELRARVLSESGFRRAAEESLARVVTRHPDRTSALGALARIRMQLGLEHAAVGPLRRLIELTGGDAQTHQMLADALRLTGRKTEAFAFYRTALELGASQHGLLLQAAQLAVDPEVRAADPEALFLAAAWLDRVAAEDPQSTRAHFVRALLCEALDRQEQAIVHYRRAVELDLTFLDAIVNLALLHAERGEVEPTREMVGRALELEQRHGRRAALEALISRALARSAERGGPEGEPPSPPPVDRARDGD